MKEKTDCYKCHTTDQEINLPVCHTVILLFMNNANFQNYLIKRQDALLEVQRTKATWWKVTSPTLIGFWYLNTEMIPTKFHILCGIEISENRASQSTSAFPGLLKFLVLLRSQGGTINNSHSPVKYNYLFSCDYEGSLWRPAQTWGGGT